MRIHGLVAVAMTMACNGSGKEVDPEDAVRDAIEAYCALMVECDCASQNPASYSTVEACVDAELPGLISWVDAGKEAGLTFDGECLGDFMDRVLSLGCEGTWGDAGPQVLCGKFHHGTRQLGEPCVSNINAQGDDCDVGLSCWAGVCNPLKQEYAEGETCLLWHPYCAPGSLCIDLDGDDTWVCERLPGEGEPCIDFGSFCGPGLGCDASGTCVIAPGPGSACATSAPECDPCLTCRNDLTCGPEPVAALGEPCTLHTDCEAGAWCTESGTCTADTAVCWPDPGLTPLLTISCPDR